MPNETFHVPKCWALLPYTYDANFVTRMRGEGLWAGMIRQRFAKGLKRYGLGKGGRLVQLDCSLFRNPLSIPAAKKTDGQLDIFE